MWQRDTREVWSMVKPLLRRALEMRRQIARDGWWNETLGACPLSAPPSGACAMYMP